MTHEDTSPPQFSEEVSHTHSGILVVAMEFKHWGSFLGGETGALVDKSLYYKNVHLTNWLNWWRCSLNWQPLKLTTMTDEDVSWIKTVFETN